MGARYQHTLARNPGVIRNQRFGSITYFAGDTDNITDNKGELRCPVVKYQCLCVEFVVDFRRVARLE